MFFWFLEEIDANSKELQGVVKLLERSEFAVVESLEYLQD